ncbi:MAG: permease-like cell division protein FtsX [Bacteroidia bacterium]
MATKPRPVRRKRVSYFTTVISITLVLFMLGLFGIIVIYANQLKNYLRENVEFSVYFKDGVNEPDMLRIRKEMEREPFVKTTRYVTREEANDLMREKLDEDPAEMVGYDFLPASIVVNFNADFATSDSLEAIIQQLEANPLVREVNYQRLLISRLDSIWRNAALIIGVFSLLFLIIAVTIINNTIRLTLFSKRFLIKSMQLVGATPGFIRRPFMAKAIFHGLLGSIIAVGLLVLLIYGISDYIPVTEFVQRYEYLLILFAAIVFLGLIITWISSYFALNRYLRLKLDELY